ncbi:MAG: peptidase M13 [Gammaproteobacteria bacterium]|nr:peptidase M13 [Gammaproteobacteria bacterium]
MNKFFLTAICATFLAACGSNEQAIEQKESTRNKVTEAPAKALISGIELANFDKTSRPQDDFYRYINGDWLDNTEIPADRSNYGSFTALYEQSQKQMRSIIEEASAANDSTPGSNNQKIGDLFNAYMDLEKVETLGIQPLQAEFKKIAAIENKNQLAKYFAHAVKIGSEIPIGLYVSPDEKDTTQYITFATQWGLGLPDRDYYFDENRAEIRTQYVAFIEKIMTLSGFENSKQSAENIMALETSLAEHHWTRVQNRDASATYNRMSSDDISKTISSFDWNDFLVAGEYDVDTFIVNQPSYLEGFNQIYAETDLEIWKEYLRFNLLNTYASYLNKDIVKANFDFYRTALSGVKEMRPRWKNGVNLINANLGFMLGKVYVDKHFPPEAKERMVELVANLTSAFDVAITELSWMGEETKKKAKDKLNNFTKKIGYPDKWQDYSGLEIVAGDLVGNLMRSNTYEYYRTKNHLGQAVDRSEWFMTPQTVNAYYNPPMNEIVFPAAILQPPFFNLEADDAVNYGAIGAVIGHEYGHGFDDQGRKYDRNGNLVDWWTEEDAKQFKTRSDMLSKQYEQFQVFDDMHVNGHLTLGENIGDLGGLTIAYKAYQLSLNGEQSPVIDGFTGEQRFFMGWSQIWRRNYRDEELKRRLTTDPHSPSRYRVIGVLSNMPEFYKAFDVKPGDKMHRPEEERVKIW